MTTTGGGVKKNTRYSNFLSIRQQSAASCTNSFAVVPPDRKSSNNKSRNDHTRQRRWYWRKRDDSEPLLSLSLFYTHEQRHVSIFFPRRDSARYFVPYVTPYRARCWTCVYGVYVFTCWIFNARGMRAHTFTCSSGKEKETKQKRPFVSVAGACK